MEENKTERKNIEDLIRKLRNTDAFRQLVPMEALSGWPVPFRKNGRLFIKIPFYTAVNSGKGNTTLFPPIAILTIDYASKNMVEFVNTRYSNPWPEGNWENPAGKFPHEAVSKMVVRDYKNSRRQLMELYDTILDALNSGNSIDQVTEKRFSELLNILMEPCLEPYYMAISPKFFGHFLKGGRSGNEQSV